MNIIHTLLVLVFHFFFLRFGYFRKYREKAIRY